MNVINEAESKKVLVEEISEENVQKVLEKYDTDSNVRKVNNKLIVLLIATTRNPFFFIPCLYNF